MESDVKGNKVLAEMEGGEKEEELVDDNDPEWREEDLDDWEPQGKTSARKSHIEKSLSKSLVKSVICLPPEETSVKDLDLELLQADGWGYPSTANKQGKCNLPLSWTSADLEKFIREEFPQISNYELVQANEKKRLVSIPEGANTPAKLKEMVVHRSCLYIRPYSDLKLSSEADVDEPSQGTEVEKEGNKLISEETTKVKHRGKALSRASKRFSRDRFYQKSIICVRQGQMSAANLDVKALKADGWGYPSIANTQGKCNIPYEWTAQDFDQFIREEFPGLSKYEFMRTSNQRQLVPLPPRANTPITLKPHLDASRLYIRPIIDDVKPLHLLEEMETEIRRIEQEDESGESDDEWEGSSRKQTRTASSPRSAFFQKSIVCLAPGQTSAAELDLEELQAQGWGFPSIADKQGKCNVPLKWSAKDMDKFVRKEFPQISKYKYFRSSVHKDLIPLPSHANTPASMKPHLNHSRLFILPINEGTNSTSILGEGPVKMALTKGLSTMGHTMELCEKNKKSIRDRITKSLHLLLSSTITYQKHITLNASLRLGVDSQTVLDIELDEEWTKTIRKPDTDSKEGRSRKRPCRKPLQASRNKVKSRVNFESFSEAEEEGDRIVYDLDVPEGDDNISPGTSTETGLVTGDIKVEAHLDVEGEGGRNNTKEPDHEVNVTSTEVECSQLSSLLGLTYNNSAVATKEEENSATQFKAENAEVADLLKEMIGLSQHEIPSDINFTQKNDPEEFRRGFNAEEEGVENLLVDVPIAVLSDDEMNANVHVVSKTKPRIKKTKRKRHSSYGTYNAKQSKKNTLRLKKTNSSKDSGDGKEDKMQEGSPNGIDAFEEEVEEENTEDKEVFEKESNEIYKGFNTWRRGPGMEKFARKIGRPRKNKEVIMRELEEMKGLYTILLSSAGQAKALEAYEASCDSEGSLSQQQRDKYAEGFKMAVVAVRTKQLKAKAAAEKYNVPHAILTQEVNTSRLKCNMCEKKFAAICHLRRHLMTKHVDSRSYQCDHCVKTFHCFENLKRHQIVHVKEHEHVCESCGETFLWKASLKRHLMKHAGERPHACDICSKTFVTIYDLRAHAKLHTGVREFVCSECGMMFSRSSGLNAHNRTAHSELRQHTCTVCGKSFKMKHALLRHMRNHTGKEAYKCDICGQGFKWYTSRKLHMKKHVKEGKTVLPPNIKPRVDKGHHPRPSKLQFQPQIPTTATPQLQPEPQPTMPPQLTVAPTTTIHLETPILETDTDSNTIHRTFTMKMNQFISTSADTLLNDSTHRHLMESMVLATGSDTLPTVSVAQVPIYGMPAETAVVIEQPGGDPIIISPMVGTAHSSTHKTFLEYQNIESSMKPMDPTSDISETWTTTNNEPKL